MPMQREICWTNLFTMQGIYFTCLVVKMLRFPHFCNKSSNDLVLNVKDGFGNLKAGCRLCGCDPTGSKSDGCDADSGQCECLPGVTGLECNMCKANHYGFSNQGCQGRNINY